jgi:hypothetical protein
MKKKKTLSNIDIRKENKAKKKPIPVSFSNSWIESSEALYMKNNETQSLRNEILRDEIEKKYTKINKKWQLKESELKSK